MSNKQPEALRLIQHMDDEWPEDWDGNAIRAELRRLHALNQELLEELGGASNYIDHLGGDSKLYRIAITKASGEATKTGENT